MRAGKSKKSKAAKKVRGKLVTPPPKKRMKMKTKPGRR